jgi:hypothetical protein
MVPLSQKPVKKFSVILENPAIVVLSGPLDS